MKRFRLLAFWLCCALAWGAEEPRLVVDVGHQAQVAGLAVSPDGRLLASIGGTSLHLWDLASRRLLRSITLEAAAEDLGWSPDGKLVSCVIAGRAALFDAATGREVAAVADAALGIERARFALDSQHLIITNRQHFTDPDPGSALHIHLGDAKPVHSLPTTDKLSGYADIAVAPDQRQVVLGQYATLLLWDLDTGAVKQRMSRDGDLTWRALAFSKAGREIVAVADDGSISKWRTKDGMPVSVGHALPASGSVTTAALSADVTLALLADARSAKVISVDTGAVLAECPRTSITSALFLPDGKTVVLGDFSGKIHFWDALPAKVYFRPGLYAANTGLMLAAIPNRGWLATGGKKVSAEAGTADQESVSVIAHACPEGECQLTLWDAATGIEAARLGNLIYPPDMMAPCHGGQCLVTGDNVFGRVQVWDLMSRQPGLVIDTRLTTLYALAVRPDDQMLALAGHQAITLHPLFGGSPTSDIPLEEGLGYPTALRYSPDGRRLALAVGKFVEVFDDNTRQRVLHQAVSPYAVNTLDYSPDGRLLAVGTVEGVRLLDATTGKPLRNLGSRLDDVSVLQFSPDGRFLLMVVTQILNDGSRSAPQIVVVAVVDGSERLRYTTGATTRAFAQWSGDEAGIVLSHAGGFEKIRLDGIELPLEPGGQVQPTDPGFDAEGRYLVLSGARVDDLTASVWSLDEGRPVQTLPNTWPALPLPGRRSLVASSDGRVRVIAMDTGVVEREAPFELNAEALAVSPADGRVAIGHGTLGHKTLSLWEPISGASWSASLPEGVFPPSAVAFAQDGSRVTIRAGNKLVVYDAATGKKEGRHPLPEVPESAALSGNRYALMAKEGEQWVLRVYDLATGDVIATPYMGPAGGLDHPAVFLSPDGRFLLRETTTRVCKQEYGCDQGGFAVHDLHAGSQTGFLPVNRGADIRVVFLVDRVLVYSEGWGADLWRLPTGEKLLSLEDSRFMQYPVASPDGRFIVAGSHDGTTRFWEVTSGRIVARLFNFRNGGWAVTDPAGHFDTGDLEAIQGMHWVMPDDPFTPLPVETFMRDYYEPRLLPRLLAGEKFAPVRPLGELNRVQPEVKITGIRPVAGAADWVEVDAEARGAARRYRPDAAPVVAAARDLRLFRNGQLVGHADGLLAAANGPAFRKTFRVRLPAGNRTLDFSAYAFNDDGVKSATIHRDYAPPAPIEALKPRAYVVTIGVNRHDNPAWNLEYAGNDARRLRDSLVARLAAQGRYRDIVPITLVSDENGRLADRAHIKAVLDRLAGRPADLSGIANGERLDKAAPDDLVLVSFSGHGVSTNGQFYLIPGDTGPGRDRRATPELLAHAIPADDLAAWLRDVDGGDMALVIDACQSAASVGNEFKPGPMGARGLGQLAYEKGMRILAASQAEQNAQESRLTQQGLLSYALVNDGLEQGKADYRPQDRKITLAEWLGYALQRVPRLAEEVARGKLENRGADGGKGATLLHADIRRSPVLQQPALFDFTKGMRDATVAVTGQGN